MKKETKKRIIWTVGCIGLLCVFYLLCSYPLYRLLATSWSLALFIFGLIVLGIASACYSQKVMISIPLGYMVGFIMGALFGVRTDEHGHHNGWQWWTLIFFICIAVGIVWSIVCRILKARKARKAFQK